MNVFGNNPDLQIATLNAFSFVPVTPINVAIRRVFLSNAAYALPVNKIHALGCALIDVSEGIDLDAMQKGLTLLVRSGVLRSRVNDFGKRLYEVNF